MIQTKEVESRFSDLGISQKMLDILNRLNFTTPTPIQHQCIPSALEKKDIVGIAQTGTGKTLAFGLPMIEQVMTGRGQGLILLPTRELALQVDEVLQKVGRSVNLKTALLIGGASAYHQIQLLKRNPHIVISTPGRLIDHLKQNNYSLRNVTMIVLDEADRMLDIGFMPQINEILRMAPVERQTLLFSATMPKAIAQIAAKYMKIPLRIEVAPAGTTAENVEQEIFIVRNENKMQLLDKLLADTKGKVLIFSRTKFGARKITAAITSMKHSAIEIHSNKSLAQRKAAMSGFKTDRYRILVATDIASRGIDVNDIALVINYDLPDNCEDYVHRIGRTGRAGSSGRAVSFVCPNEKYTIRQIERLIQKTIPIIDLPELPSARVFPKLEIVESDGRGRYGSSGSSRRSEDGNNVRYSRPRRAESSGRSGGYRGSRSGGSRSSSNGSSGESRGGFVESRSSSAGSRSGFSRGGESRGRRDDFVGGYKRSNRAV